MDDRAANPATVLCEESIEVGVEGCQHGHRYQVPCSRAKRFSENPESCTELVSVLMPFCGHKINVPCHREGTISEHPRNCFARCHRQIGGCGHLCQRQCGDCLDQTLKKNPQFILSSSNVHLLEHKKCQSLCGKILFCGHLCKDHCHPGKLLIFSFCLWTSFVDHENCSPCQEKCSIVCEHQKESNHRKCSDKRESCVEPCSWKCEHQGECTLPCGVPCKRLPCDHRCRKQLACGCQCPSLCGEECPSDAFCHVHADPTVKNMVCCSLHALHHAFSITVGGRHDSVPQIRRADRRRPHSGSTDRSQLWPRFLNVHPRWSHGHQAVLRAG